MSDRRGSRARRRWPSLSGMMSALVVEPLERETDSEPVSEEEQSDRWSSLLPELLGEIVRRVEVGCDRWPQRRDVVSCAGVCKRWRDVTKSVVRKPIECGKFTFPSSLKQVIAGQFNFFFFLDFIFFISKIQKVLGIIKFVEKRVKCVILVNADILFGFSDYR